MTAQMKNRRRYSPMITPTIKGSWRKDPEGIYRVYIHGTIQYDNTIVEVESRSGDSKFVTLTGTYSKVSGGYLYHYKTVDTPIVQTVVALGTEPTAPAKYGADVTAEELEAVLGL
jgi:hypothetical protein